MTYSSLLIWSRLLKLYSIGVFAIMGSGAALAQSAGVSPTLTAPSDASRASPSGSDFWTPQRMLNAKPKEMSPPPNYAPGRNAPSEQTGEKGSAATGKGSSPTVDDKGALFKQLYAPLNLENNTTPQAGTAGRGNVSQPQMTSSTGAYFTTGRVFPDATTTVYPYSAIGKLFYHDPRKNLDYVCSASVLRPRVVVTAGHCVYHPASTSEPTKYFYSNWLFIPSFNNGSAPRGTWNWAWVIVSGYWANGNGSVPNTQDVAIFEMQDKSTTKIGNSTGWLGYQTGGLLPSTTLAV